MVCNRCIMAVRQEFENIGLPPLHTSLGEVELSKEPSAIQMEKMKQRLSALGFEVLDDQKRKQIEKIKTLLVEKIQSGDIEEHFVLSDFLSSKLHKEYSQL